MNITTSDVARFDGLRRDFDAIGIVIQLKDVDTAVLKGSVEALSEKTETINRGAGNAFAQLDTRLGHYERTIPVIAGQHRALTERLRREQKAAIAAQQLAAQPETGEGAKSENELVSAAIAAAEGPSGLAPEAATA
jgi:hypothetical protein